MSTVTEPPPSPAALARAAAETWPRDPDGAAARLAAGLERLERAAALAPGERTRLRARLGQLRIFLGDVGGALRVLYDALEIEEDGYVALQLASALAWRGDASSREEAAGHAGRASTVARRNRDGPLAIGALCVQGELALAGGRPDEAARRYGEALGITEFSSSDAVTVTPLAGLAEAHLAGRAPRKAPGLARRALERARRLGDRAGEARALLALGAAEADVDALRAAAEAADAAPHRPLALRARLRRAAADGADLRPLRDAAERMGLLGDLAVLERARRG
jgi:tetratricopeptide (TPR) repeat protein